MGTLLRLALAAACAAAAATGAGCASAVGAGGPAARTPIDPRTMVPPGIKAEWLHFADPAVAPGQEAPDFTLPTSDGGTLLSLSTFRGRPLVVVFGSYT